MYANIIPIYQYACPFGTLILGDLNGKICLCDWARSEKIRRHIKKVEQESHAKAVDGTTHLLMRAGKALDDYFNHQLRTFDLPLAPCGTPFQKLVWEALDEILYGRTTTYSALANKLGLPKSVRAVAAAVANNPLSIIRPCHRVVGSGGKLTGYAGGLDAKRSLLQLEGIL